MKLESSTSSAGSAGSPSGSEQPAASRPSRTAKSSRSAKKCSKPVCETALWILPPSVPTFESWTESLSVGEWKWSAEASPAKTYRKLASGRGSTESAAVCGGKWQDWFARFDPDSCSWKTSQISLFGGCTEFSVTWPHWGFMLSGECFQLVGSVPHIAANGCGLLPTPRSSRGFTNPGTGTFCPSVTEVLCDRLGIPLDGRLRPTPSYVEWMMGFPEGWTDTSLSGTPLSLWSSDGLDNES